MTSIRAFHASAPSHRQVAAAPQTRHKPNPQRVALSPAPQNDVHDAAQPYVQRYGVAPAMGNPLLQSPLIKTQHNVDTGVGTDQKASGRCWIFSGLNLLRQKMLKQYGKDFQYSQNYVAYWDKFERANSYFDKMIELRNEPADSQRVLNWMDHMYTDGGDWELFRNVVQKHGLVPSYAMPETDMASNSNAYMGLLTGRVRELGGLLHMAAQDGASKKQLNSLKQAGLTEVKQILNKFLGSPPETFWWKTPEGAVKSKKAKKALAAAPYDELTPLQFLAQNPLKLDRLVHITNFPNHPYDARLHVQDVNNVSGAPGMQALNLTMDELKEAVRNAIKDGSPVLMASEVKNRDAQHDVWALAADGAGPLLGIETGLRLGKGDRLRYRATGVAHGMMFTGCDDADVVKYRGKPPTGPQAEILGPMWRVENSWKDHSSMYMTDAWVDEYVYGAVVDERYLPAHARQVFNSDDTQDLDIPSWDPFGRV